jgi:uncharacterized membrane protein YhaH (DUF805 family)
MTFTESIKTCFTKFTKFEGRASRSEYWWYILFIFLASLILTIIHPNLASMFYLIMLLPTMTVTARRLHDTNRSGWLQILYLVPFIGFLIMLFFLVQEGKEPNLYGPADS